MLIYILIGIAVIIMTVLLAIPSWLALRPIYQRDCAGIRWRRRFPEVSAQDIREFLLLFVDAFGFPRKHQLRFRPEDRIMDLYRALNPPDWSLDNMEIEFLSDNFKRRYHVDLIPLWHEGLTLGDIFSYSRSVR
jgi:propanediol dehydratase small subunit